MKRTRVETAAEGVTIVEEAAPADELVPSEEPAPAPPPPAEVRTVEAWAEAKGMLPEFIPIAAPFAAAGSPRMLQHNPEFWRFHATRTGWTWPIGKELTEAQFDAAVLEATTGHQYR